MIARIINVGSEFLSGYSPESGAVIAFYLSSIGINVKEIYTVGDNVEEISSALNQALEKADIVAVSGGMGSLPNDLTREGAKKALGIPTAFSRPAMENVAGFFAKKGQEVPSNCDNQAEVIRGAKVLLNPLGSCPGQLLKISDNKILILLPGYPQEVRSIFKKTLLKILKENYESGIRKKSIIHMAGVCEGMIPGDLKKIIDSERHLEKGELEFFFENIPAGLDIHIIARGDDEILIDELIHKTKAEIYAVAGKNIYGENDVSLQEATGKLLGKNRKTVSVAESCTGGMLSSKLTDVPGSSIYFDRGIVAYSASAKQQVLKVKADTIKKHSPVSPEVAVEMAENIKNISGSDYGLSLTGYAGPSARKGKKPGVAYAAVSGPEGTKDFEINFSGSRKEIKERFAYACLEKLWRTLKK